MEKIKAKKSTFQLRYKQKDITSSISPVMTSVVYTDYEHGQSDEIEIRVEDKNHKWKRDWYPVKGDTLSLFIGYEGKELLPCGDFEIDNIAPEGPPDTLTIGALATGVMPALRTKNSVAYEETTLKAIAEKVAGNHSLTLIGEIEEISLKRVTQNEERDLQFLKRIAEEYGYLFTVKGDKLIFTSIEDLKAAEPVLTIDRKNLRDFSFRDQTSQIYKAVEVKYHDPKENKLITYTYEDENIKTGDTLKLRERCESKEQAIKKAKAAIHNRNERAIEANFTLEGNTRLVAGNNFTLTGFYTLDGVYHIKTSRHKKDKSGGYTTEIEAVRNEIKGEESGSSGGNQKVVSIAESRIGTSFHPGESEQCAYFAGDVYREAGYNLSVNGLAESFQNIGPAVAYDDLQPGDAVLFSNTYGNFPSGTITHVGIYTGNGKFVHRPTKGGEVVESDLASYGNFAEGRRPE